MASFAAQFDDALARHDLLPPGTTCLIAVSGGRDSMVLLRAFADWQRRNAPSALDRRFVVGHFHHQLRGEEADADQALVASAARDLGWDFIHDTADVRASMEAGESLESCARRLRHAFLARAALDRGASRIATGHHAGDQSELVLLRLLRGAGGHGLGGMLPVDPSPANPGLLIIRPLLGFSPAMLGREAAARKVPWRADASNADLRILRNRVRHELLPLLESRYHPGISEVLVREAALLRAQADALELWAGQWLAAQEPVPFEQLPVAVAREVIRVQLREQGHLSGFDRIEHLRLRPGSPTEVAPDRHLVRRTDGRVVMVPSPPDLAFDTATIWCVVEEGAAWCEARFGGCLIAWNPSLGRPEASPDPHPPSPGREWFDADAVGPGFRLRHWRPGDRFEPIGLGQAARLQDLFTNARVTPEDRRRRVVAETGDGRIFWVEGLRIGEIARLRASTRRHLAWRWQRPVT